MAPRSSDDRQAGRGAAERAGWQQRADGEQHDHQRDDGGDDAESRPRPGRRRRVRPRHRPPRRLSASRPPVATDDGSGLSRRPRSAGQQHAGRRDRERHDAEEDPAPPERLLDHAGHARPHHRRDHPGGREGAEDPRMVDGARRCARPRRRARRSSPRRRAPAGTARPRTARSPEPARRAAARPRRPPPRPAAAAAARSGPTRARRRPSPRRWRRASRRTPPRTTPGRAGRR